MKLCLGCMEQISEQSVSCPFCGFNETADKQESYYLKPGTIVGRKYIIGRVIKYGGCVVKYIGMDAEKEQKVAISEYLPSDFSTRCQGEAEVTIYSGDAVEQFREGLITFLNEGNQLQQMGVVPGIARIYDCIAENETGYVITEYLEDDTLQKRLDNGMIYSAQEAKKVIEKILCGLTAVHNLGIIHCDIAPDVIGFTESGEAKLMDFGAARYVTTANSKSMTFLLKQGYAPEEQYSSLGDCGTWTDVYALGAVLYRMITGKQPPESIGRTLNDELSEPSRLGVIIEKPMENALMNALDVYQKDRTPSAEIFYRELKANTTKRNKVKEKKRANGKLPLWIKGLVAVVICMVIVGGVVVYKNNRAELDKKITANVEEKFTTGVDRPFAEFQENWDKKWTKYHFSMELVTVQYRYDATVEEDTVREFEDMTKDKCLVEGATLKAVGETITTAKSGKENVIARIVVASPDKYTFLTEWKDNFPMEAGESTTYDQKMFYGDIIKGSAADAYGKIQSIEVDGETVSADEISTIPNPVIIGKNKVSVTIYTGAYYVMKRHTDRNEEWYEGKALQEVLFQYGTGKGDWKNISLAGSSKYDSNYISFTQAEGTITEVMAASLKNGKKYDGRKESGVIFDTVGEKLSYGNITVGQLKQYCSIQNSEDYPDSYLVTWLDKATFKKGATVKIKAEPKATPTPKPQPKVTEAAAPTPTVQASTPKKKESPADGDLGKH